MIDLNEICKGMDEDAQLVIDWVNELYDKNFSKFFKGERELFKRLESKTHPITDEELEWILTTVPLELFSIAEKLSEIKTTQEVIRMKNKKDKADFLANSTAKTQTQKNEDAEAYMAEKKLIDTIYSSIIDRVEREVSFSRELIMSSKKIWDRRRQAEDASPINPVNIAEKQEVPKTFWEQQQAAKGQPIM